MYKRQDLTYTDRKFNSGNTSVEEQSLYMATVNICELSHKEVELRCELTGNVAEGYSAGKVQLSQTSIAVRGQEEEIAKVSYAKVIFDIGKNTKETITADLDYQFYDEEMCIRDRSMWAAISAIRCCAIPRRSHRRIWRCWSSVPSS